MARPSQSSDPLSLSDALGLASGPGGFGAHVTPPLSSFVGRDNEIGEIVALLKQDDVRLINLTGPGGIGKTRLALRVCEAIAADYKDGVSTVSLASIRDSNLVLHAIAQSLSVREVPGGSILTQITGFLRERQILLLLDNFEQVAEAGPHLSVIINACPQVKILVTGRVVLHLSGERDISIRPLELPEQSSDPSLELIARSTAVQLFVQRAKAAFSDFQLTESNAQNVVNVCRRVDGLPLAIELSAARVAHLSLPELMERLEQSLPLLVGGARDQPARQQTMSDTIAWSYDLLASEEQTLFAHLAVFEGGFTLEAAETVAGNGVPDMLKGVSSLIDKSLLRLDDENTSVTRFLMLQTVQDFAIERLAKREDSAEVRARHASFFADLAVRTSSGFYRDEEDQYREQVTAEQPNLRAAATWALNNGYPEYALRIGTSARSYTFLFQPQEALHWLQKSLDAPSIDPLVRADALFVASTMTSHNDPVRAAELAEESRAIAIAQGDRMREVNALSVRAFAAEWSGDFDLASALHEEGLFISQELGNEPFIQGLRAFFVCNLADAHVWRHNPEMAIPLANEALACWRAIGLAWAIPFGLQTLGASECMMGNQVAAAHHYGEALSHRVDFGDQVGAAGILEGIAGVAVALKKFGQAANLLGAAHAMRDEFGVRYGPHWLRGAQVLESIKTLMDAPTFEAAWDAGSTLTAKQAIELARQLIEEVQRIGTAVDSRTLLTTRELEVLSLIVEGRSNPEIGSLLFISHRTAQTHVTNILGKLGVTTRTEAAARAVRDGLI